jgi:peptidoglycan/LPS O-acetylase OafA/YrhL
MVLADQLKSKENNYHFLRFFAAVLVLFSHSFPLTGRPEPLARWCGVETLGGVAVFIFFTISGLLITKSWLDDPRLLSFFGKRFLRIVPGLAVAVVLMVVLVGPLTTNLPSGEYWRHAHTRSYLRNVLLFPGIQFHLPGVFTNLPLANSVNGSLWTLPAEALAYGVVAVLGFVGVLRYRALGPLLLIAFWVYNWHYAPKLAEKNALNFYFVFTHCMDCYHYFLMGAVLYLYRDKVTLSGYAAFLLVLVQICTVNTPHFRLVMRFALPYVVLYLAYCRLPLLARFGRRADYSYGFYIYAFPIQQVIVLLWLPHLSAEKLFLYAFGPTLLCAVLSWHLVEVHALRLKGFLDGRKKTKDNPPKGEVAGDNAPGKLRAAA